MDAFFPTVMFIVGVAVGGGVLWLVCRQQTKQAAERERHLALADVRVAQTQAAAKDSRIQELQSDIAERDHLYVIDAAAPQPVPVPMTSGNWDVAGERGAASVHVNRVLKGLEGDGLISRKRRFIHFDDWRRLQDAGDFSRRYLHVSDQDTLAQTY